MESSNAVSSAGAVEMAPCRGRKPSRPLRSFGEGRLTEVLDLDNGSVGPCEGLVVGFVRPR